MLFLMMIRLTRRVKVALELFRKSMSELLVTGRTIVTRINTNPFFATPPSLAALTTALDEYDVAIQDAITGGQLQTAIMYQKREVVEDLLAEMGNYVEGIANSASNAGNGDAVVLSAGMLIRRFTPRQPQVFSVKNAEFPSVVLLTAAVNPNGSHEWQYNLTPADDTSWIVVPATLQAHTFVTGLTSNVQTYFRHRALLKDGFTPWDATISIKVN